MNIFKLLKKNKLFYNFEDKEINMIFDCLHGHINKYSRGRVVAEIGQPVDEIGIILSGAAVKFIKKPSGELENCGELYAGDMFGEVDKALRRPHSATRKAGHTALTEHRLYAAARCAFSLAVGL